MNPNLKGKVALVTGAARGIGKTIAWELAKAGASVVVCDIDSNALAQTEKEFRGEGIETFSLAFDVADAVQVGDAVSKAVGKFSKIDILVNNAGITKDSLLVRSREEDWDSVISVNLKGTMNCTKSVLRGMMKNQWGRIVNISSIVGQIGNVGQSIYSATKAAVIGFTKTVAREVASRNITVNAVAPGYIKTDMTDALSQDIKEKFLQQIPLGRIGEPRDVAMAVLFLCLDESSYITGQVLCVNGGMAM